MLCVYYGLLGCYDLQSTHVQAVNYLNFNKRLQSNTAWQSICYAKAVTYVNPMHTQDISSNTITYPMLCPMLCHRGNRKYLLNKQILSHYLVVLSMQYH